MIMICTLLLTYVMDYSFDQYKRNTGKVFTSSDGYKYFCHKSKEIFSTCVLFRKDCKGSAKLEKGTNLIYPKSEHYHGLQDYSVELYAITTKCKTIAQTSQHNLRQIFNDVTRSDPSASQVTFKECESSMFRARKILQPMIPQSASEFSEVLPTATFAVNLKATVIVDGRIAVIFFSDKLYDLLADITNIQFDGTFYTVPKQFCQLWTLFLKGIIETKFQIFLN